jgi:hypothetical protein
MSVPSQAKTSRAASIRVAATSGIRSMASPRDLDKCSHRGDPAGDEARGLEERLGDTTHPCAVRGDSQA